MTTRPLIFLCHSSGDKIAVHELGRRLRADGKRTWLDADDLLPGQDWQYEIRKAIERSDVVLVCMSADSVTKTGFVQREIRFVLDAADERPEGKIFVVPVRLEPCRIPDRLTHLHWVDLYESGGYGKLLRAIDAVDSPTALHVPASHDANRRPARRDDQERGDHSSRSDDRGSRVGSRRYRIGWVLAAVAVVLAVVLWSGSVDLRWPESNPSPVTSRVLTPGSPVEVRWSGGSTLVASWEPMNFPDLYSYSVDVTGLAPIKTWYSVGYALGDELLTSVVIAPISETNEKLNETDSPDRVTAEETWTVCVTGMRETPLGVDISPYVIVGSKKCSSAFVIPR